MGVERYSFDDCFIMGLLDGLSNGGKGSFP